jgi:hypothetical protein
MKDGRKHEQGGFDLVVFALIVDAELDKYIIHVRLIDE